MYHVGIFITLFLMLLYRNSIIQVPVYFLFILIPLQITYIRKGKQAFLIIMVMSFIILLLFRLYMTSSLLRSLSEAALQARDTVIFVEFRAVVSPLLAIEMVTLACLMVGLAVINLYDIQGWRLLYKLLAAAAGAAVVGVIMVLILNSNREFTGAMERLFAEIAEYIKNLIVAQGNENQDVGQMLDNLGPKAVLNRFWDYVLGGLIFGYFINLSAAWYGGTLWGNRFRGRHGKMIRLVEFCVPDAFVWPLLVSWGVILMGQLLKQSFSLGGIEIIARNVGLVFLFLFGIQGLSILRALLTRYQIARRISPIWIALLALVLLVPPLTVVFLVLVPGLGVSEIWIKYRLTRDEKGEEE